MIKRRDFLATSSLLFATICFSSAFAGDDGLSTAENLNKTLEKLIQSTDQVRIDRGLPVLSTDEVNAMRRHYEIVEREILSLRILPDASVSPKEPSTKRTAEYQVVDRSLNKAPQQTSMPFEKPIISRIDPASFTVSPKHAASLSTSSQNLSGMEFRRELFSDRSDAILKFPPLK